MRKQSLASSLIFFLGVFSSITFAQSPWYKFGIVDRGVYKITEARAKQLGFNSLSEIAFFGYPGMLPQKLDSAQLPLQEIPSKLSEDALYVYLEGPSSIRFDEEGELIFQHHSYTDTLRYLIGEKTNPIRIESKPGLTTPALPDENWYSFRFLKEEKTNLLNSGRSWYSDPIRQGQSLSVNFGASTESTAPWLIKTKVMTQSSTPALVRILTGDQLLTEIPFDPIPTSTYGIKGREQSIGFTFSPPSNRLGQIRYTFQGTGAAYLDFVAVGVPQLGSNLPESVISGKKIGIVALKSGLQTWEISQFYQPISHSGGTSAQGKNWVIFRESTTPSLTDFKAITPRKADLPKAELLIITVPQFLQAANRLKSHKLALGIPTEVILSREIFDAYGYGNPDVSALRNFIASAYHSQKSLKNVLILGKGTFDYKNKLNGRANLIPIYTSRNSLDPLSTYSSDDYLGLIQWGQGEWLELNSTKENMQIGIGRIPAITFSEVSTWVDKVMDYEGLNRLPSNVVTFLADDGDNGIHMRDAESHASTLAKNHAFLRSQKLYLDRFKQERSGTSQSSLQAKTNLETSLTQGSLLVNYIGHGNETTLTAEELFKVSDLENWPTQDRLPLWVTATCEFGRHDSPFIRSAAEELLFAKGKGAVGLLTTGRPVFSSVNFQLNQAFMEEVFVMKDGLNQDLGQVFMTTKNKSQNGPFNRNFSLLGDPSLRLKIPELGIQVKEMIDFVSTTPIDSLRPLSQVELSAEITDPLTNTSVSNFNGNFEIELWDAPQKKQTLGDENEPFNFSEEDRLLFKGEGTVTGGKLTSKIFIPEKSTQALEKLTLRIKAIDPSLGMYSGGITKFPSGGKVENQITDRQGPTMRVEIANESKGLFTISSKRIKARVYFEDQSGIYISSENESRALKFQINDEPPIPFSEKYRAFDGDFKRGQADLDLENLKEGLNEIIVSAWDNVGNGNSLSFSIEVKGSEQLRILDHKVFPNPANEESCFFFRHNRPGENLLAKLEVYSLTGQILFSESRRLVRAEEIIEDWNWIFLQSKSKYPGKGTYIYNLSLFTESDFTSDLVSGKLVIQ